MDEINIKKDYEKKLAEKERNEKIIAEQEDILKTVNKIVCQQQKMNNIMLALADFVLSSTSDFSD